MAEWKSIQINIQNIETRIEKAVLINCPQKSKYSGYSFWHPSKLIRDGKHSYAVSLSYTDEFEFTLHKYGKNKTILGEIKIRSQELEAVFGVMNENISAPKHKDEFEVHVPREITSPVEVTVDENLRR